MCEKAALMVLVMVHGQLYVQQRWQKQQQRRQQQPAPFNQSINVTSVAPVQVYVMKPPDSPTSCCTPQDPPLTQPRSLPFSQGHVPKVCA